MTIRQISFYAEKLVLVLYISLLLLQIFLSVKEYKKKEYVDTRVEDKLFNVDFPMIILCAEKPHRDGMTSFEDDMFYIGFDRQRQNFVGWATENMSTFENLKSRARVTNVSDLVDHAWLPKNVWSGDQGPMLEVERLRIMHHEGQCFTLVIPKEEISKKISETDNFIVGVTFKNNIAFKIYLLDPNTYNGYSIPRERKLAHGLNDGNFKVFDVSVAQVEKSPHDPAVVCESYQTNNGFFDCVTERAEKRFISLIGCVPPWFTDDEKKVCQKKDTKSANSKLQALRQYEEADSEYSKLMLGRLPKDCLIEWYMRIVHVTKHSIFSSGTYFQGLC